MSDKTVIQGQYFRDLLAQPQALRDTLAGLQLTPKLQELAVGLDREKYQRIVLTGMGGSFHALHPLNLRLTEHGFTSVMAETSELIHYMPQLLTQETLLIAVSQSGRSAETLRLLEMPERRGPIIGITNTEGSPLATRATAAVVTRAGNEFSVSCKTWVAAVAAMAWIGEVLCEGKPERITAELAAAADAMQQYLNNWERHVGALIPELEGIRDLFTVGRGSSLAAALTAGLTIKESTRVHSEGMSSAAMRHGPFEILSPEVFVLVYEGDSKTTDLNRALISDVRKIGARAVLCGPHSDQPAAKLPESGNGARPVLEMLPAQMISLALAAIKGIEAGKFQRIAKVTATE
ncbi:MAG TPA: SIS domain-containing protein [Terriglobales bacterium]|nr:SIS domain-containing protein [Terriglobales bacterium]